MWAAGDGSVEAVQAPAAALDVGVLVCSVITGFRIVG